MSADMDAIMERLMKNNVVPAVSQSHYRTPEKNLTIPLDDCKKSKVGSSAKKRTIGWRQ